VLFESNLKKSGLSSQELKSQLRKLWSDHVYWTRLFIVSALGDLPDVKEVGARLIQNQQDIGTYVGVFYPNQAEKITDLLTEHIKLASEVVDTLKKREDVTSIRKRWYSNADDIVNAFYQVNQYINLRSHFYKHLSLTEAEITNRLNRNYAQEIVYFDDALNQSREMSDAITSGITKQYSTIFR